MEHIKTYANTLELPQKKYAQGNISPMPFWLSTILFSVPALVFVVSYHLVRPWLETVGLTPFESMVVVITVPMSCLFAAALIGYHRIEGFPLQWSAFTKRFRLPQLTIKTVLWGLSVFIACMISISIFSQIGLGLITKGMIPIPKELPPILDPRIQFSLPVIEKFIGGTLQGNWSIVIAFFVMLFFNIVGEELWWRGYILPRQELVHGRWTWLVHGLMWTGFHIYQWWNMIGILPVCLIISYTSQRLKNNWPAFIAHYLLNGLALVMIFAAVIGL